jgi:hypothetical protein
MGISHTWRDVLAVHPAADMFPLMSPEELRGLADDINKNGLREHVALVQVGDEMQVLDGRNRLDALELLGREMTIPKLDHRPSYRGSFVIDLGLFRVPVHDDEDDAYAYVISRNIYRRNLTPEQKRELIAKLLKATPEKSNRQIGALAKADKNTVNDQRKKMESTGEIHQLKKTVGKDGKARKQPAKKATKRSVIPPKLEPTTDPFDLFDSGNDATPGDGPQQFWERSLANHAGDAIALEAFWTRQHGAAWRDFPVSRDLATLAREAADAWISLAGQLDARVVAAAVPATTCGENPWVAPATDDGLDIPDRLRRAS